MDQHARSGNRFLASLSRDDFATLAPFMRPLELRQGDCLHRFGDEIEQVVFPNSGLVCMTVLTEGGAGIQAAAVGRDGVVGCAAGLGFGCAVSDAFVQISGTAFELESGRFREAVQRSPAMRDSLMRSEIALLAQAQQTAACNAVHTAEERVCRWLLEIHDRSSADRFPLTQESLAQMLGVRRTTVTLVERLLQSAKAIKCRRGFIEILNRPFLEDTACECYERVRRCTHMLSGSGSGPESVTLAAAPFDGRNPVLMDKP